MGDLTENFSRREFACKCGCGKDNISRLLVDKLQLMRTHIRRPISIASGVRCAAHNKTSGGKPNSAHLTGDAVDIVVSGGSERKEIVDAARYYGLNRVGVARSFVHVDISKTLPQDVLWVY